MLSRCLACVLSLSIAAAAVAPRWARASAPSADEQYEARRFVAAKIEGKDVVGPTAPVLVIQANNDPVQKNARAGRPLRIGGTTYSRGLFCHAVSKIAVRLDGPAKTFSAAIGVDSNEQTGGGQGSVVFSVNVAGKSAFRSGILHEGMPATPVDVELGGASEFALEVGDAGDGIGCDQAAWADARVTMADGQTIWLSDLPATGLHCRQYTAAAPFSFTYAGKSSADFLRSWPRNRQSRKLDDRRTEHVLTFREPGAGLVLRCVAVQYHDFPMVEWTLHFKNSAAKDSPVVADIQALDFALARFPWPSSEVAEFRLHHQTGSPCRPDDYEPFVTRLESKRTLKFAPPAGRPNRFGPAVLQRRDADERRGDRGRRLAGPVGGQLRARRGQRPSHPRRPGADAPGASSRRGNPLAAGGPWILEGRLAPLAKRVAALDAGPQPAPARRASSRPCNWPRAAPTSSAR